MTPIEEIIKSFAPITLKEMDAVALLDRIDTKFVFPLDQLPCFLEKVSSAYRILEVNNVRLNKYETLYYDTNNFFLFLQHHNGKLNRYKVRYRCYADSMLSFFEVKLKNNKSRTIKQRIKSVKIESDLTADASDFLSCKTPLDPKSLAPKLWVYYSRMTLVNKCDSERVTIDVNLKFSNKNMSVEYPSLVIAEVKQGKSCRSPFLTLMRKNHIRTDAISKYCMGIASVFNDIKKNNFKPKMTTIKKISHVKV